MQLRTLGKSGLKVSPIIFGAWAIGGWMWGGSDDDAAISAIHAAIDQGITTIDTAAIYGMGHSEEIVGRAIKGRRNNLVIATKCGMRWDSEVGSDPWPQKDNSGRDVIIRKNSRPDSIAFECEQSLKRMGIDVIDLLQIHWPDISTPIQDSIRALEDLRKAGKIRAFGVSNYSVENLKEAISVAPLASDQPAYSLVQRKIEADVLPFCRENGIGVICYSPLERGLLTGSVGPERKFPADDHRSRHKFFSIENRQRVADALAKIKPIADAHKASFAQIVIQWTIQQPGITAALVGARNADQVRHNVKAMDISLSADERGKIRAAFDECAAAMSR